MIKANHIINLCSEIETLEEMLKNATTNNNYMVARECEIKLGNKYNTLMAYVDLYNIENIDKDKITIANKPLKTT